MTVLAPAAVLDRPAVGAGRLELAVKLEHAAVFALLLWWAVPLTRDMGGRGTHTLSYGLVLLVGALVGTCPWRRLSAWELVAASTLPLAALVVCLVAPTGWLGANDLASWAFAVGTYVVVRAYARGRDRVPHVLVLVALAGLAEFASSWLAWWGNADPAQPMIGTFYWHNQFGAFLLVPALIGVALAVWPQRPGVAVGWVVAPLCSAGVLFSTSRATLGLLGLGWIAVMALALCLPGRRRAVLRVVAAGALTAGVAFALTGPPFFAHRAAPSSAVAERSAQESATGNAAWRTHVWRQAVDVYREYPVVGTGFHGFGSAASKAAPGQPHSAFAHNAWLQAFAEGGTTLGLPFLLVTAILALAIARQVLLRVRTRDPHLAVAGIGTLLLAAHSLVDFDTSYPALFAALAIGAALALAPVGVAPAPMQRRNAVKIAATTALALVAAIGIAPAWHGDAHLNVDVKAAVDR